MSGTQGSLFSEWNQYLQEQSPPVDEESGFPLLDKMSSSMSGFFESVQDVNLVTPESLTKFCFLFAWGVLMIMLAFFIGLPVIALKPQKFAFCFTVGSFLILGSFSAIRGLSKHLRLLFQTKQLPFTILVISSQFATLYACFILRSRIYSLISAAVQLLCILIYVLAEFPGGRRGIFVAAKFGSKAAIKLATTMGNVLLKCILRYVG
eukprot:Rmarinus@m.29211